MNAGQQASPLNAPAFADIDRHFARLIERLAGGPQPEVAMAAALASRACGEGHACLNLQDVATIEHLLEGDERWIAALPAAKTWIEKLRASPVVGAPGEFKPLVLDAQGRLYLHRYWEYESELANAIKRRAGRLTNGIDSSRLADGLSRLFPASEDGAADLQKAAALVALRRSLCVISGGPGTGKTRTVALALALLLEQAGETPLRIKLTAPTGKAAARLQESVRQWRDKLNCDESVRERFPSEASTVHRLLGGAPGTAAVWFGADNPLPVDVLVLDEASMVDLAMMARLFAALPEQARIILVGDRDQLASVEAGAVLGDICGPGKAPVAATVRSQDKGGAGPQNKSSRDLTVAATTESGGLADCIVQLEKNYRFAQGSGILELSLAVNRGDADGAARVLKGSQGVSAVPLPPSAGLKAALRAVVTEHFATVLASEPKSVAAGTAALLPEAALTALNRFRILTALRQGPFGVENLNRIVEEILNEARLISPIGPWYSGRPVLVTENDYSLRLFNGEVGIILPEPASGTLKAYFAGADGQVRSVLPSRLPRHETVFAMTVHKSQGSEFGRVLLVMPDRESPVLTRELVYTGITRASESVEVWMNEPIFRKAVERRVERASGLREALWPK